MSKKSKPQLVPAFLQHPDLVIKAVNVLRQIARDPKTNDRERAKVVKALQDGGVDEETIPDQGELEQRIREHCETTLAELERSRE